MNQSRRLWAKKLFLGDNSTNPVQCVLRNDQTKRTDTQMAHGTALLICFVGTEEFVG